MSLRNNDKIIAIVEELQEELEAEGLLERQLVDLHTARVGRTITCNFEKGSVVADCITHVLSLLKKNEVWVNMKMGALEAYTYVEITYEEKPKPDEK